MAVPTSALRVDSDVSSSSPKGYTKEQLQEIAATVPAIYDRLNQGWTGSDFQAAAQSSDPRSQQLGKTYQQLFASSPSHGSLEASFDGRDLVVDKGNHRVMAARSIDVPVLPVWVKAPTSADVDRIAQACEGRIQQEGNAQYLEAQQKVEYDRGHTWSINGERAGSPENYEHHRSGPEFLR